MSEWSVHMGCQSDRQTITIDWFDHNNIRRSDTVEIVILPQDKPRTLTVRVNNRMVWKKDDRDETYVLCEARK